MYHFTAYFSLKMMRSYARAVLLSLFSEIEPILFHGDMHSSGRTWGAFDGATQRSDEDAIWHAAAHEKPFIFNMSSVTELYWLRYLIRKWRKRRQPHVTPLPYSMPYRLHTHWEGVSIRLAMVPDIGLARPMPPLTVPAPSTKCRASAGFSDF